MAVRILPEHGCYALWFRPEVISTVIWAGDPNKPVSIEDGQARPGLPPPMGNALESTVPVEVAGPRHRPDGSRPARKTREVSRRRDGRLPV